MGCNVCKFNNEQFIENEFKYAYNNQFNQNNKETEENKENNKINENNDNDNKNITIELDGNEKEEKIKSNELLKSNKINPENQEIKLEKKELNNESLSSPRTEKLSNNIKINNRNNQNKEETKDETNKKIIISEQLKQANNNTSIKSELKNPEKLELFQINQKPNNINNNSNNIHTKEKNDISINSIISSFYKNDYNTRMVDLINKLRTNPKEYAKVILSNIQYIQKRVKITADDITGQNEEKEEIFFQKKIKVELYRGEIAFFETAEFLRKLKPLKELIVKEEIKMNLLPETEEQIRNDKLLIKNQLDEIKKRFNISAFFKDNLKNPEIGLMLMIIGDNKNSQNKKRNALLNPNYKYIAINSKFIGDKFVSYFTFSK